MPYKDPEKRREYARWYYSREERLEKRRKYMRQYREKNRDKLYEYDRRWCENNPEKKRKASFAWYKRNPNYVTVRRENDVQYRLCRNLRARLTRAISRDQKSGSAIKDLGCSIEQLKSWLMYQFQEGMTWDNYGEWHIDHVKPLNSFDLTDREQLLEACNWYNLQPLWAKDNLKKGHKLDYVKDNSSG